MKQFCLIERAQVQSCRAWRNHICLCLRAFLRLESHCHHRGISWYEAKTSIIREAVRAFVAHPPYSPFPTAELLNSFSTISTHKGGFIFHKIRKRRRVKRCTNKI